MINRPHCILTSLLIFASASAQIIFHEPFDFGPGVTVLGNENGWQADYDDPSPSEAELHQRHTQEASPFSPRGLALQPSVSRFTTYRKLPESLNGKNVFFSYSIKPFRFGGVSGLRFRASDGAPLLVGVSEGKFVLDVSRCRETGAALTVGQSYFIVGQIQISEDGRELGVAAQIFTDSASVPTSAPATAGEWPLLTTCSFAKDRTWDGVNFLNASADAAFDDLRIGYQRVDVIGKK